MKKTTLILGFIILLHLTFVILSADQLYYGDEVVFLTAAKEIASGQISGSFGYEEGVLIKDKSIMLYHPPTYIYLLSLIIFLFGESTYSVRIVSLLFSIGSIILVYLTSKKLLEKKELENIKYWSLFAAFLYAINPVTIQNIILIEINGGLLNFALLLFIYLYISGKPFKYLIPSLFLIFASKLTGITILFVTLIITNILTKNFKELFRVIKLHIITGILFSLIFIIYVKIFDLNFYYLFFHNSFLGVLQNFLTNPSAILRSLWAFRTFFYFTTPFFVFLFILISFKIIINVLTKKEYVSQNKGAILLFLYSLVILAFNLMLGQSAMNFVKYYSIIIAPITILLIYFTPKKIRNFKKIVLPLFFTSLLILSYFIIFLHDPLIPEVQGRVNTLDIIEVIKLVLIRSTLYAIIPLFLCFILFNRIPKKKLWLILIFLFILTSIYLNILHTRADYSTHNMYGDRGLEDTISYLKDKPPENVLCYIHLCYFLDYKKSLELTTLFRDMDKLDKSITERNIQYMVIYKKDFDILPENILKKFNIEKQIEQRNF